MQKTIEVMKKTGLFDSLVCQMANKEMPKEAVFMGIDAVCHIDEDFADTFFEDVHDLGMGIIYEALQEAVQELKVKYNKDVEDLKKAVQEQDAVTQEAPDKDFQKKVEEMMLDKVGNFIDAILASFNDANTDK